MNGPGKIAAISDVHGMIYKLEALLDVLPIRWGRDQVVFLGDYIDRGPDPRGVISKLIDIKKNFPNHVNFLLGNHEFMFLNYLFQKGLIDDIPFKSAVNLDPTFFATGGENTLASYHRGGEGLVVPDEHMEFLLELLPIYETDDYCFVHAGLKPHSDIASQTLDDILWIRYEFIESDYDWGKTVVFGHTPLSSPLVHAKKIGIDTGAVYGGPLTAVILPDLEFVQV